MPCGEPTCPLVQTDSHLSDREPTCRFVKVKTTYLFAFRTENLLAEIRSCLLTCLTENLLATCLSWNNLPTCHAGNLLAHLYKLEVTCPFAHLPVREHICTVVTCTLVIRPRQITYQFTLRIEKLLDKSKVTCQLALGSEALSVWGIYLAACLLLAIPDGEILST